MVKSEVGFDVTLSCEMRKRDLAWKAPGTDFSICSSQYRENLPVCHECLIDYCLQTNCLGCLQTTFPVRYKYPDCPWLEDKKYWSKPN